MQTQHNTHTHVCVRTDAGARNRSDAIGVMQPVAAVAVTAAAVVGGHAIYFRRRRRRPVHNNSYVRLRVCVQRARTRTRDG